MRARQRPWKTWRRVRWALASRLIREELEAFGDARYASMRAKVGGDLILARAILEGTSTLDQLEDAHLDVDFLATIPEETKS